MATAFHSHHAEQRWLRAPYTVARKYTDKTGARFSVRDYGPDAPNQQSWHCTYPDGTYAYSNPSGSKYHDFGHGNSIFVAADGDVTHKFNWVEQPSSFAQKASAKAKALRAEDEKAMREAQERESHAQAVCKKELGVESEGEPQGAVEHKSAGEVKCEASAVDADSIASRVKKEER